MSPPIRYVIHACGPLASQFPDVKQLHLVVATTFYNCLLAANKLAISSLSIPAISSGIFGVPKSVVADAAYEAVMEFDQRMITSGQPSHVRSVNFVNFDSETTEIFTAVFQERQSTPGHRNIADWSAAPFCTSVDKSSAANCYSLESDQISIRAADNDCHTLVQSGAKQAKRRRVLKKEGGVQDSNDSTQPVNAVKNDDCVVCMEPMTQPKQLPCGHKFCTDCIDKSYTQCQPKCPSYDRLFDVMKGNQPPGTMSVKTIPIPLSGYEAYITIEIEYNIPDGIQDDSHPNPGQPYSGTYHCAYLPNNAEGKEVCNLLREAFDARLIFTVGRSTAAGHENCVIWNDVHHKTSLTGQFGYPDATYLERVKSELAAKGIGISTTPS
jgi:deltex-like protein